MTREEKQKALYALKKSTPIMAMTPNEFADYIKTLNKMADWLEQEPCEDTISRQAVLEGKVIHQSCDGVEIINSYAVPVEYIEQLPSIQPKTQWIPVSKKLPKEDGEYLLFGKIDEDEENYIFIGEYDSCAEQFGIWQEQFDRTTLGCLGSEFFEYSSVLAWQPLPEPYEESEE